MRGSSRLGVVALALLIIASPGAAGAGGSTGSGGERFGIRLLDIPTERTDDPRAHQYVVDHLRPGQSIERRVQLSNDTPETIAISLYAGAAVVEGGEFRFGTDRAQNELTGWTTITPSAVTLAPGERAEATVHVAVPTAARSGERYAVVWAEAAGDGSSGIRQVNRVGIRMYLSVGDGEEPPSDFEIVSLTAGRDAAGSPIVNVLVTNTGARAIDLSGTLALDDGPGGLTAGPFPVDLGTTLAPGERGQATVVLDPALPAGPWRATATISSGLLEKQGEATLTFPIGSGKQVEEVEASAPDGGGSALTSAGRAGLAVAVIVFTAAGVGMLLASRRRRRRHLVG